jgi:hypothetical protein
MGVYEEQTDFKNAGVLRGATLHFGWLSFFGYTFKEMPDGVSAERVSITGNSILGGEL